MSNLDFAGRVAIITGAGRGMGRSHARMLASRGARVVVNDLNLPNGENPALDVVAEIQVAGGVAVGDYNDVVGSGGKIIETALDAFGQIDILICNAGVLASETLAEADPDDWYDAFDVHFRGTVDICKSAWPHLIASGTGRIVTTSSSGMLGNAGLTSYGSAKGGIFSFTRSLAMEGRDLGIKANTILPSAKTRITDAIRDPAITETLKQHFQPEHVSALVTWLVHQDTQVTCEAFQVSGGRAGRVMMAAMPTVRAPESTPEIWARMASKLMEDGPLVPLRTTAEMFAQELADANPQIRHAMNDETGGLTMARKSGREG